MEMVRWSFINAKARTVALLFAICIVVFETPDTQINLMMHAHWYRYVYLCIKAVLPVFLLVYMLSPSVSINAKGLFSERALLRRYALIFAVFLMFAVVPTIANGDLIEFAKLIPRFVLALAIAAFLVGHGYLSLAAALGVIGAGYFLIYLVVYVILEIIYPSSTIATLAMRYELIHEAVIFGRFIPSNFVNNHAFLQFRGVFGEPSNASAFYGAMFFVLTGAYAQTRRLIYRLLAGISVIATAFTFSWAGYIAMFFALIFGWIFMPRWVSNNMKLGYPILVGLFLFLSVLRPAVVYYPEQTGWLLGISTESLNVVSGALKVVDERKQSSDPLDGWLGQAKKVDAESAELGLSGKYDLSDGRLGLAKAAVRMQLDYPLGIGIQNVIRNPAPHMGVTNISPSALFFWLTLVGVPGVLLILLREFQVVRGFWLSKEVPVVMFFQGYLIILIQNMSYGTWMMPMFFLMALLVIVTGTETGQDSAQMPVR